MPAAPSGKFPRRIGRYVLYEQLAEGGMAKVFAGKLVGHADFGRIVAIKRMHPHLLEDKELVAMFLDEARIAARIRHPNVVPILDVLADGGEVSIVMEYVHGDSLARVMKTAKAMGSELPLDVLASIATGMLMGLHGAHEAMTEDRRPLGLIHRDVSPQNVMIGADGVVRVLDFGVAKAIGRQRVTRTGDALLGKLGYMSPEQLTTSVIDRRSDLWAASVVLWEMLTGRRLFHGDEADVLQRILGGPIPPPSQFRPDAAKLDAIVLRGLERDARARFATALDMCTAIEEAVSIATPVKVQRTVAVYLAESLRERERLLARIETSLDLPDPTRAPLAQSAAPPRPTSPPKTNGPWSKRTIAIVAALAALVVLAPIATWIILERGRPARAKKPRPSTSATATAGSATASAPPGPAPVPSAVAPTALPRPPPAACLPGFICDPRPFENPRHVPLSKILERSVALVAPHQSSTRIQLISTNGHADASGIDTEVSVVTISFEPRGEAQWVVTAMASGVQAANNRYTIKLTPTDPPNCALERLLGLLASRGLLRDDGMVTANFSAGLPGNPGLFGRRHWEVTSKSGMVYADDDCVIMRM